MSINRSDKITRYVTINLLILKAFAGAQVTGAPEVEASVRILTSDTRGAETDARNSGRGAAGSGQLLPGTRSAQPRADVTR